MISLLTDIYFSVRFRLWECSMDTIDPRSCVLNNSFYGKKETGE